MLVLETNISKLRKNLEYILSKVGNSELYAVVKADAYGHGIKIAEYMKDYCNGFAVNNGYEARRLGKFYAGKIYILGGFEESGFVGNENSVYTVSSFRQIEKAAKCGVKNVAIKVNTGMNRLGFSPQETDEAVASVKKNGMYIDSIYTHLFDPTTENALRQLKSFRQIHCDGVKKHIAASNFLELGQEFGLDAIRCGLAIYGYGYKGVEPIAEAYSEIIDIHSVKKGDYIGYGRVTADKDMNVATIAAGYADGINRKNSGKNIEINGCFCPIVGNICMDMCMADISGLDAKEGDRAYFLSRRNNAEQLAENCNTIVYEILTSFGSRVRRIYV